MSLGSAIKSRPMRQKQRILSHYGVIILTHKRTNTEIHFVETWDLSSVLALAYEKCSLTRQIALHC